MRSILIFLLLAVGNSSLWAQNGYYFTGAGEAGMGHATTAVYSSNVMFQNIGTLASAEASSVSFGYDYRDFVSGLNNIYMQYINVRTSLKTGVSIYKTGDKYLNEFVGSVGVGHKIGIASIGIKMNYLQLYSEAFGYSHAASVSAGVLADLSKQITIGAYLNNVGVIAFNKEVQEFHIPVVVQLGVSYKVTDYLLLAASATKDLDHDLQLNSGISYQIIKQLYLRTGISWYHKDFYYGIGWYVKKLHIDYALNPVSRLGQVHSLTVTYKFRRADEN